MLHKLFLVALLSFFPPDQQLPWAMCAVILHMMVILLVVSLVRQLL